MIDWWNALSTIQQVFYIIAIPSTIILVLQVVLLLFGVGGNHDADASADGGAELPGIRTVPPKSTRTAISSPNTTRCTTRGRSMKPACAS